MISVSPNAAHGRRERQLKESLDQIQPPIRSGGRRNVGLILDAADVRRREVLGELGDPNSERGGAQDFDRRSEPNQMVKGVVHALERQGNGLPPTAILTKRRSKCGSSRWVKVGAKLWQAMAPYPELHEDAVVT